MCLIVFAAGEHPRYKFILAANRDEFYMRPTAPAAFWSDEPQILAGKDLAAGGTWLGITKTGRFAAVTNYRDPSAPLGEKSRGDLTRNFLSGTESAPDYLQKIEREKEKYSGFNLLVGEFGGDKNELFYFSNRAEKVAALPDGIYGLSNHLLDSNWQKVVLSKNRFAKLLLNSTEIITEDLFQILADSTPAHDTLLPETGVGIERERILSSAFIKTTGYGTRSSTVLKVDQANHVSFTEKTFVGEIGIIKHGFTIEK